MQALHTETAQNSAPMLSRIFDALTVLFRNVKVRRRERLLRVCETLSLGEKRFLAIVQFEDQRFLIGSTSQSISLLVRVGPQGVRVPETHPASGDPFPDGVC